MRTRRSNNSVSTNGKKKDRVSVSSPDVEAIGAGAQSTTSSNNTSINTTAASKGGRKSPNSSNSAEKEGVKEKKKSKDSNSKGKKRRVENEGDSKLAKKKKERSDSESGTESSSVSGAEDVGNEVDSEDNNQEELSGSSRPSSRSSVERGFKPVQPQPPTQGPQPSNLGGHPVISPTAGIFNKCVVSSVDSCATPSTTVTATTAVSNSYPGTLTLSSIGSPFSVTGSAAVKPSPTQPLLVTPAVSLSTSIPPPPQQQQQQLQPSPFLSTHSGLHPLSAIASSTSISSSSVSSVLTSSSSSIGTSHLRPPTTQLSGPSGSVFKPGPIPGSQGHISNFGTFNSYGSNPGINISSGSLPPSSCNLQSPLVIPTPSLSRVSSTGTFIPHTELSVPTVTGGAFSNIDSISSTSAKTSAVSTVGLVPSTSVYSRRSPAISSAGTHSINNSSNNSNVSSCGNTHPSHPSGSTPSGNLSTVHSKMQESGEEQDKKPSILPPPHSSPFLPPPHGAVPFSPYHPYYYPHPSGPHLPSHSSLHPGAVPMSVTSSTSGNPHLPPPPVPSLVPIKKEPHSPPPPLKPSEKPSSSDLSRSSPHHLHRPLPENPSKLPPGFPPSGISSSAPLPPPPLIEHRDSSKQDDLSKPDSLGSKDNPRSLDLPPPQQPPASSLRPDNLPSSVLPPHRESRMDNNLIILRESREIGLVGGLGNPSSSQVPGGPHSQGPPPPSGIKEETRSLPAAFQPYPHNPAHSSAALLQVPQPHMNADHHGPAGVMDPGMPRGNSAADMAIKKEPITVEIDIDEEEDDDMRGGSLTPGPPPTLCNKEVYKSNSAIFVKVADRGERNQCSRTDFIFKPLHDSPLIKKREENVRKASSSHAMSSVKEEKKRVETPPRATSASEGQKTASSSSSNPSSSHPSHSISAGGSREGGAYPERHTPRPFADTPALRQLHEYARPHVLGQEVPRGGPYQLGGLPVHPHMDPLMGYRLGMYPPGSRERLEMDLERDKRERDAREREMRERELRELELREKMKADMELKPQGLERLLPPGAMGQLTDPSWLDLQRRMGFPPAAGGLVPPHGPPVSVSGSHLPGVYTPVSLSNDLLAREREKLDRLDGAATTTEQLSSSRMVYQYYSQRLSSEQHVFMQRVVNECYLRTKPDSRPLVDPNHLIYQFSRADPMAAGPSNSNPSSGPLPVLPPGIAPHHLLAAANSREELLQRELYSRGGPFLDPAIAHQLSAQAAAHEALQRHIAMERERFGSGHLPH